MSLQSKKVQSALYVSKHESLFRCPICKTLMKVVDQASLVCSNRHTFDFTKQGYINLLLRQIHSKYEKQLFEARRKLIVEHQFFAPLSREIAELIKQRFAHHKVPLRILDTGCGEGSHLAAICNQLSSEMEVVGVGIDIAKEGIQVAAKNYSQLIWTVADLANTPFQDEQFDVILNILSPSNYSEFARILHVDGILIKVVPRSGYLQQLRQAFYTDTDKQTYSNEMIVEHFQDNFQLIDRHTVQYTINCEREALQCLVQMTPLTWKVDEDQIRSFAGIARQITVDVDILIGKR